jgi:hypothetical protein
MGDMYKFLWPKDPPCKHPTKSIMFIPKGRFMKDGKPHIRYEERCADCGEVLVVGEKREKK